MEDKKTKYWPRIFSKDMMAAIAANVKTQTRRPLTPTNTFFDGGSWPKWAKENIDNFDWEGAWVDPGPSPLGNQGPYLKLPYPADETVHRIYPRVQVGDVFWTREKFTKWTIVSSTNIEERGATKCRYEATCDPTELEIIDGHWKSPIYQKFKDARFHLPIIEVGIERANRILEEDARAEGVSPQRVPGIPCGGQSSYAYGFKLVWDRMYAKRPHRVHDGWSIAYKFSVHPANGE